ncbi:MAG: isoprenyl transferase [Arsenophonus sp.]|nr:MAG: isoprenyl transferase [Arsenophonus sp.]
MHSDSLQHQIPKHVAIIMDGNGRWAKKHGKLRINGHKEGIRTIQKAIRFAMKKNIQSLTLYAFSSENWKRPKEEVKGLMKLFIWFLDEFIKNFKFYNIKLSIIGDMTRFKGILKNKIKRAIHLTENNTGLQLNIAANYGGRWDITHGIKIIAEKIKKGLLSPEHINEDIVDKFMSLHDQPNVDLIIRTGREYRISNFLLWQAAYSEFYFTDVLWPDFDETAFQTALVAFNQRERRFGKIIS